jgi:predicted aldo/keto reductase-like oxidoreductase
LDGRVGKYPGYPQSGIARTGILSIVAPMQRRNFLKTLGAAGGLAVGYRPLFADPADPTRALIAHPSGLPRRVLGRTGQQVSIVAYPCLALSKYPQVECDADLRKAFEAGVNYYDVAPAYGDAEIKLGTALGAGALARDRIFLASKTKARDAAGARKELERSLQRLKTDRLDLYQLHVLSTPADVAKAFGPDGAVETLVKARDEGKVRWLGFSAHTKQAALDALKGFNFETVMYPVNFVEHYLLQFDPEVLALARERSAAVVAIKPISAGAWRKGEPRTRNNWWYRVLEDPREIELAIRFSLSFDPVVSVLSTSFFDLMEKSIAAGVAFRPATEADFAAMRALAQKYAPLFAPSGQKSALFGPHADSHAHHA